MWSPPLATFCRPITWARAIAKRRQTRLKKVASLPLMVTRACNRSQILGTAKNNVGWISRRFSVTVSIDSAKFRDGPAPTRVHVEKILSATWHSGRYVTMRSLGLGPVPSGKRSTSLTILSTQ